MRAIFFSPSGKLGSRDQVEAVEVPIIARI